MGLDVGPVLPRVTANSYLSIKALRGERHQQRTNDHYPH